MQARFELAAIYDKTTNKPANKPQAAPPPRPRSPLPASPRKRSGGGRGDARCHLAIAVIGMLFCSGGAHAASSKEPTIKDLEKQQQVDVSPDPPQGVDSNKTMQSYKRFLDLNAGDAALREEAMRRLGDFNLESSESERIEHELATNEGLRATEAIHLYTALLKAYPKYERNDSVLYQLARAYELNAQPDKALATLDRLVASYPGSKYIDEAQFRRGEILFANKILSCGPGRLRGGHQVRSHLGVLQSEPLQARLVALQAGRKRAEPRLLRKRTRLGARLEEGSQSTDRARNAEQAQPRARRGYVSCDVDHLLLPGRRKDHRGVREASQAAAALLLSSVCAARRSVHGEGTLYGCRGRLSRLRLAGPQQREGAAPRDAGDRSVFEGRLSRISSSRERRSSSRTTATARRSGRAARRRASRRSWRCSRRI